MKAWHRIALCATAGLLLGAGGAAWTVRAGGLAGQRRVGPWTTGGDFGTVAASAQTRAIVALHGLLALPAHEARYYTAVTDDAGAPLDGQCRYRVTGGRLPAKWWSLTLYDAAGYLVPNQADVWAYGSAGLPAAEQDRWTIDIAPSAVPGHWLPTGGIGRFALTLRVYLPSDGGVGTLARARLPRITRQGCQ